MGNSTRELSANGYHKGFFFSGKTSLSLLLKHQYAKHFSVMDNWHTQERVVDFFADFLKVGKIGMLIGILQIKGLLFGGDQADQALTHSQSYLTNTLLTQTLGSHQNIMLISFIKQVDRTHLCTHRRMNFCDDNSQNFG